MPANLYIEEHGRVVVLVHNGVPYTEAEFQSIVALAKRPDLSTLRIVVHDEEGGSINTQQRRELVDGMGPHMPMAAVLTGGRVARGVVAAIGWFKPGIKAFAPEQVEKACQYLGLTEPESAFVMKALPRLRAQLPRKAG